MAGTYFGRILSFEVRERSPKGTISFNILTAAPTPPPGIPGPYPKVVTFKLDEDSDQSFDGMAAICARWVNDLSPALIVVGVISGAEDEIDTLRVT